MFLSRTSPLMFGLLGAIALHLSPVVAVADDVVHACVKEATGAVRLVKTDTECRPYETAVAWARRGPAGQRGQTGAPGEAGRSIILKDAAGGRVGILIDLLNTSMALVLSDRNYTVLLETGDESLVLDKELVFDDPECGAPPHFCSPPDPSTP